MKHFDSLSTEKVKVMIKHNFLVPAPNSRIKAGLSQYLKKPIVYTHVPNEVWDFNALPDDSIFPQVAGRTEFSGDFKTDFAEFL